MCIACICPIIWSCWKKYFLSIPLAVVCLFMTIICRCHPEGLNTGCLTNRFLMFDIYKRAIWRTNNNFGSPCLKYFIYEVTKKTCNFCDTCWIMTVFCSINILILVFTSLLWFVCWKYLYTHGGNPKICIIWNSNFKFSPQNGVI